ncbi:MAG: hypothetical protein HY925_09750 [Elusimicrobia bacterium]|nr:hypothetical protein [Elusimicrobiota bacterium]
MPMLFERAAYLACLAPFLVDRLRSGRWPSTLPDLAADAFLGLLLLAFVLLKRLTRRRVARVDALRETLNQALIHDLKNPMTSILGAISVVLEDSIDEGVRRKLLEVARRSCLLQMELLETLVDASRLEFGELSPRIGPVRARPLIDSCLEEVSGLASHAGVELERLDAMESSFFADEAMIRRVLINLLLNAVKYTPAGGTVELRGSTDAEEFVLEVRDSGVGIPPAQIGRLFQKYYRVEGEEQSVRRGSGIGLYYSKLVIDAHRGTIEVFARAGGGTTIRIRLPQARSAGPVNASE